MSRDFDIPGPALVLVKGRSDSAIGTIQELGLSDQVINVTLNFRHKDINVECWGDIPPDVQFKLADIRISFSLIHFDRTILEACISESMGGAPAFGQLAGAGFRLGNGKARFASGAGLSGNHLIGLNITSPINGVPWRFLYCYMEGTPAEFPLGTEKSIIRTNWRCIPYTQDPYNGGLGAYGVTLCDHTLDT